MQSQAGMNTHAALAAAAPQLQQVPAADPSVSPCCFAAAPLLLLPLHACVHLEGWGPGGQQPLSSLFLLFLSLFSQLVLFIIIVACCYCCCCCILILVCVRLVSAALVFIVVAGLVIAIIINSYNITNIIAAITAFNCFILIFCYLAVGSSVTAIHTIIILTIIIVLIILKH